MSAGAVAAGAKSVGLLVREHVPGGIAQPRRIPDDVQPGNAAVVADGDLDDQPQPPGGRDDDSGGSVDQRQVRVTGPYGIPARLPPVSVPGREVVAR
jgi:hypothetical protein